MQLTLSEMTHNISLNLMRKVDTRKQGYIEERDLGVFSVEDPAGYELLEDLFNFAPDFLDKHRRVIAKSAALEGSPSMAKQSFGSREGLPTKVAAKASRRQQ